MNRNKENNQSDISEHQKPPKKKMPVWMLIVTDLVLAAACLGVFLLYQIVLPKELASANMVVATADDLNANTFALPGSDNSNSGGTQSLSITPQPPTVTGIVTATPSVTEIITKAPAKDSKKSIKTTPTGTITKTVAKDSNTNKTSKTSTKKSTKTGTNTNTKSTSTASQSSSGTKSTPVKAPAKSTDNITKAVSPTESAGRAYRNGNFTNYGNTNTDKIASDSSESAAISSKDKVVTKVNSYRSDKIQFTTNKIEIGSGRDKITCYVSDIYVTNVKYLKTAFASGTYGKNITDTSLNMAKDNNALLALSGDYYGNSENSVVIRNGVLYRSSGNDADVCVLFTDGTMKTYSPDQFDAKALIKKGAWQAWTFGPALLDGKGKILKSFNTTDYLYGNQPRSAIGYVAPGHYVFAVVDGRNEGYSRGASLNELAQIMVNAKCKTAYNLDGGKSASMVYNGNYVNQPAQGGREISDIIYIGE